MLGNVAEELSSDLLKETSATDTGPTASYDVAPVKPLESAEDFTEIQELAEDDQGFKVNIIRHKTVGFKSLNI